jgi:ribosomal silencing factor RsfS
MKRKLSLNMKLEQDSMEGVDEEEWVIMDSCGIFNRQFIHSSKA